MLFVQKPESLPPLHRAAFDGNAAAVRRLIAEGVDLEKRCDTAFDHGPCCEGQTPLMVAAGSESNTADAVMVLLELGSDPRAVSRGGVTALWYAAGSGDAARVRVLLDAGGDPGRDCFQRTHGSGRGRRTR